MQSEQGAAEAKASQAKKIKWTAIGLVVVAAGVVGFLLFQEIEEEAAAERWDKYAALREKYEPDQMQDPIFQDPYGIYGEQRERYVRNLEKFLEEQAKTLPDALEPHVRWRLARTLADHILSMKTTLDFDKRSPHYEKAIKHLTEIRDDFPDFQLNWANFKPAGFPTVTRQFIHWLEENRAWEQEHLPKPKEPDGAETVVLRTTRGDLHLRLYATDAPNWTKAFLERAVAGEYDGTAFFMKREQGDDVEPFEHWLRAGAQTTRGAEAFNATQHIEFTKDKDQGSLLLEESRNRIPHDRGIVSAWHGDATEYDHPSQFIVCRRPSPSLDYDFTPVGKLIDDASLETLDRIWSSKIWRSDPEVSSDTGELRGVLDFLQVPVEIVKVLVYRDGALVTTNAPSEHKAEVTAKEEKLATLERDALRVEEPEKPEPKNDAGGDEDDGAEDGDPLDPKDDGGGK